MMMSSWVGDEDILGGTARGAVCRKLAVIGRQLHCFVAPALEPRGPVLPSLVEGLEARLLGTWARDRPGDVLCVAVDLTLGAFAQRAPDECAYNVRTERTQEPRHARQLRPQRPQEADEPEHQQ